MVNKQKSIQAALMERGVSQREFLRFCGMMAGALALPKSSSELIARKLEAAARLPVVWLELQDCAGCSEAFLRASSPSTVDLLLDILSVDYQETIMAASGFQAEASKAATLEKGGYILVVEGSISMANDGVYCCVGGKSSYDLVMEAAANSAAVIAVGNCAAFGGVAKAAPNPTQAVGVDSIVLDKPVLNIPGCPVNTVNLVAAIVHYLSFNSLPETDDLKRPLFAFGHLIHDNCERRGHFAAGEFVREWGDEGHRNGWCLYKMGCKGPITYHNCPAVRFNDGLNWPVAAGHPCIGCSQPDFWDMPTYEPVTLQDYTPPNTYPEIKTDESKFTAEGAAISGGTVGVIVGAAGAFAYTLMTNRVKNLAPDSDPQQREVVIVQDSEEPKDEH